MPYEGESDRELVARVHSGETSAFTVLHRRYYSKVYRLAYVQTGNRQDAEDVASETFCRAFERIRQFQFRGCNSIYPWLYRIAANLCIDLCRDRSRAIVSLDNEMAGGLCTFLDAMANTSPTPEEILEREEVHRLVHSAIAALSPGQREAVVFRFLGDLSIREIAGCMGRSDRAIKSLLHRGTIALRKEILDRVSKAERLRLLAQLQERDHVRGDSVRVRRGTDQEK